MDEDFKADLARIYTDELPAGLTFVSIENPASYGWQRRSELDVQGLAIWESPDGSLAAVTAPTRDRF